MSDFTSLLPMTFALSGDSAIEAILTDIPLFCEGIMSIGVFTFLFLTKQVKLLSIFLYGSSFLAFASATLDLSQVLARGPQDAARGIGLDTVTGFVYAREVFLSLSIAFLNLFFWTLVAHCPRGECAEESSDLSTDRNRRPQSHSASWNRWGLVGMALKWGSLAALLSVPLLQMLWRLMPGQRKYASIYVAEGTIQTSVTVIFILKCLLNVYISPLDYWWHAFRIYLVPISALAVGTSLGIGNLILFSFTETSLGRFLRAVEVYILILHSLYTTFQAVSGPLQGSVSQKNPISTKPKLEGSQYKNTLPFSYPRGGDVQYPGAPLTPHRRIESNPTRSKLLSWTAARRMSIPIQIAQPGFRERDDEITTVPSKVIMKTPRYVDFKGNGNRSNRATLNIQSPSAYSNSTGRGQQVTAEERPFTAVSLSYYTMEQTSPKITNQAISESPDPMTVEDEILLSNGIASTQNPKPPSIDSQPASQQGSITSMEELFRQQNELDKSIAALRLLSMQTETEIASEPKSVLDQVSNLVDAFVNQSRNTLTNSYATNKTESCSNRSDFSLSVFPNPPIVPKDEVATKYVNGSVRDNSDQSELDTRRPEPKDVGPIVIPPHEIALSASSPSQDGLTARSNSAAMQYDVTSFIGDLTGPSTGSELLSADDLASDIDETPTISTAVIGPAVVLRPMILASMVVTSPSERSALPYLSASTDGPETMSPTTTDISSPLRPFLLGKAISSIPQPMPSTMVPLAQRRKRGGTLQSSRRPVISGPRINQEGSEAAPGAYERPRPPPLVLIRRTGV